MSRRKLLIALSLVAAVLVAPAAGFFVQFHGRLITPEQADRVKSGMTLEEVQRVLGSPGILEAQDALTQDRSWKGQDFILQVRFDTDGTAFWVAQADKWESFTNN